MGRVIRSESVERDLLDIWLYIAQENEPAADRLLRRIEQRCSRYATQPLLGERRPELSERARSFPVGNYVVIYEPLEDGIALLLVTRGCRDIHRLFDERFPRSE